MEPLQGSPFIGELFCLVPQEGKSGRTDNQNTSFAEEGGVGSWVVDVCAGLNHSHLSHVALGRRAIVLAPWPRRVQTPITSLQQVFKGGLPHVHAFQRLDHIGPPCFQAARSRFMSAGLSSMVS